MKPKNLFALWGGLFVLCAALGFVNTASTALQVLMTVLSIAFFLPGALLLRLSKETGNREIALLVRNLSAASLILTVSAVRVPRAMFMVFTSYFKALTARIIRHAHRNRLSAQ